ncbi:MAG: flagellin hook IN motif-containing protein, partial [Planctomycetota bacterium]
MTRINTNVSSLLAQRTLNSNQNSLNASLTRLSTGLKINTGADNPAGLIASENLRSEKSGILQAIDNGERASNIIGTAEGGLSEVSALLNELQGLVSQSANTGGLSKEEIDANQLQIDSILETVNRLASATSFQGQKLLDGSYDYATSGADASAVQNVRVNAARIPDGGSNNVVVEVTNSATQGVTSNAFTSSALSNTATIEVKGTDGVEQLSFGSGTALSAVVAAVNAVTVSTGVTASVGSVPNKIVLRSEEFGSDESVSVKTISGTFFDATDTGSDAAVQVNGATATTDGLDVTFRNSNLDVSFRLTEDLNAGNNKTFSVTGGGADFALGSKVTETDKAGIGLQSVSSGSLGNDTDGFLSSLASGGANQVTSDNLVQAQRIIDESIKQVSQLRGRLGAFQRFTIGSTINSLGVAYENASAAESAIRDTDFA